MCGMYVSIVLSLLPSTTTKWCLTLILIAFGLTANGWSGVHFVFVGECASKKIMGITIGLAMTIGGNGIVFGPTLCAYLWKLFRPRS